MKIFLVYGQARSGKGDVALAIKQIYTEQGLKVAITEYSKYLKLFAEEILGWDGKPETKPRTFLQELGQEIIKEELKMPYLLLNRMKEDIIIYQKFVDVLVIADNRLIEQIEGPKLWYPKDSYVIKVVRPNHDNGLTDQQKDHITETEIANYNQYDLLIKNIDANSIDVAINNFLKGVK